MAWLIGLLGGLGGAAGAGSAMGASLADGMVGGNFLATNDFGERFTGPSAGGVMGAASGTPSQGGSGGLGTMLGGMMGGGGGGSPPPGWGTPAQGASTPDAASLSGRSQNIFSSFAQSALSQQGPDLATELGQRGVLGLQPSTLANYTRRYQLQQFLNGMAGAGGGQQQ